MSETATARSAGHYRSAQGGHPPQTDLLTGIADATGAAPDSAWLEASERTPYLDALRRITIGMRTSVANPASVVVSFAPGYHFGDMAADRLVTVTGTHGSLRTSSSLAYFMSTAVAAPDLLRSDRLLPYLGDGL